MEEDLNKIVIQNAENQINNNEVNEKTTGPLSRIAGNENANKCPQIFSFKIHILMLIAQFLSLKEFAWNLQGINRKTSSLPIEQFLKGAGISDVFQKYFQKDDVTPDEIKSLCSLMFDADHSSRMFNFKSAIENTTPYDVPVLLYSFTEQGNCVRFFPFTFSSFNKLIENDNEELEVFYGDSDSAWKVKYFEDFSISALQRTRTSIQQDDLPISNKLFITKNLRRHLPKISSQELRSNNLKWKIKNLWVDRIWA